MSLGLVFSILISTMAQAQANRAPWIAPFMGGNHFSRPGILGPSQFQSSGYFNQAPAFRPFLRPQPGYAAPWGYGRRPPRQGNNILSTLLPMLNSLLGGGGLNGFNGFNRFGTGFSGSGYNNGYNDNGFSSIMNSYNSGGYGGLRPAQSYAPAYQQPISYDSTAPANFSPFQNTSGSADAPPPRPSPSDLPRDMAGSDQEQGVNFAAPPDPREDAVVTTPDTLTPGELIRVQAKNEAEAAAQRAPIWRPFLSRFQQCAPGCVPLGYSAYAHNRVSCHNSGRAIDVFGMRCQDGVHWATESSKHRGRIAELTVCMTGPFRRNGRNLRIKDGLGCLWHNGPGMTKGHRNHVHFSIGCEGMW